MSKPNRDESKDNQPGSKGIGGPTLLYIMLGIIVAAIVLFLVFHPRGANSGGSHSATQPGSLST